MTIPQSTMRAPDFWSDPKSTLGAVLAPLGAIYGFAGLVRQRLARPWRCPVPVICVGNLTAGGAGKTPVALAIGAWLAEQDTGPHFLSRGYGGRARGPLRVDPRVHSARDVGDEALLLAEVAPTWVARDRAAGARAAAESGARIIVMDDGFQNPSLVKDIALLVVDAGYGFGNRRLIPAGPLREPVARGLARAQGIVVLDGGGGGEFVANATGGGLPVLGARLAPDDDAMRFAGERVFAFAGIGRPQKFFDTLASMDAELVGQRAFADHHVYDPEEIMEICEIAAALEARPVTTAKDWMRLSPAARPTVEFLRVGLEWRDPPALANLLGAIVRRVIASPVSE